MILHGDALHKLKELKDDSIDCICCDPPYGYSFMNKDWDKAVIGVDTWKECLRVLKPGAFAAIMSSPRQDVLSRMIVNLQDAGFRTDFTSIYWTYACLSEDTEVLTLDGWERFNKSNSFKCKSILCYDIDNDRYQFENPKEWKTYNKIQDTLYRIKSDNTDQLVTRNHRCIIEREGKLLFQFAEELGQTVSMPYLESLYPLFNSVSIVPSNVHKERENSDGNILFDKLQAKGSNSKISSSKWQTYSQNDRKKKTGIKRIDDGREEQSLERGCDLFQNSWQLYRSEIHSLSKGIFDYGSERWLCNGTSYPSSKRDWSTVDENRGGSSYRSQSGQQLINESNAFLKQSTSQEIRTFPRSYKTTVATVTKQYYQGLVFCPVVSTGCFVARRNGKIFLTGNSGFPKAANVSKLVDKRNGRVFNTSVKDYLNQKRNEKGLSFGQINEYLGTATNGGGVASAIMGDKTYNELPTVDIYNKLKTLLDLDNRFDELIEREEAEREIIGPKKWNNSQHHFIPGEDHTKRIQLNETKSATDKAKELDGSYCGLQVKPAVEVILIVMKPLSEKTFVDQALSNGKGITWLDKCKLNQRFPANLLVSDSLFNEYSRYFDLDEWFETTFPFIITPKASKSEKNKGLITSYIDYKLEPVYEETKLIRKNEPNKQEIALYLKHWRETKGLSKNDIDKQLGTVTLYSWFEGRPVGIELPTREQWLKLKGILGFDDKYDKIMTEYVEVNKMMSVRATKFPQVRRYQQPNKKDISINHHPTVKPIKLMSYLIALLTKEGETVLDPFCGSGTTLIAAKMLNRKGIGIEINKEYIEIAEKRLMSIL